MYRESWKPYLVERPEWRHRFEMIRFAWTDRCQHERDWLLKRWENWFYAIKAIILLLLNKKMESNCGDIVVSYLKQELYYHHEWGEAGDLLGLTVGHGFFNNWHYSVIEDGWP